MNYLNIFDKATFWIKYIHSLNAKYYKNNFLEIGAGIGSFTDGYKNKIKNIYLTEIGEENLKILENKYQNNSNIYVYHHNLLSSDKKFNTIAHYNVLEHIEKDKEEIENCLKKINSNGFLIILVPAHNSLYSKLDKEVGHYRRYDKSFFKNLKLRDASVISLKYVDCLGFVLYYLNKLVFKNETFPTPFKIFIWDKLFTPITYFLDKILFYKFGKNILYIIKKSNN